MDRYSPNPLQLVLMFLAMPFVAIGVMLGLIPSF